jgi:hypothetical protein
MQPLSQPAPLRNLVVIYLNNFLLTAQHVIFYALKYSMHFALKSPTPIGGFTCSLFLGTTSHQSPTFSFEFVPIPNHKHQQRLMHTHAHPKPMGMGGFGHGHGHGHPVWALLHTRDWEPMTTTLQALSLVKKEELVQVCFTLCMRDQQSMWMQGGCEIYVSV